MTRISFLLACALALLSPAASAQQAADLVEARLLPGWQRADGRHVAALHLRLRDGWKTYWRAPGDAGIPPQFSWTGSRNLGGVEVSWPTPRPILQGDIRTIGYERAVTLPLTVTPAQAGRPVTLAGEVTLGVCKDVCVPLTLQLSQALPQGQTTPDARIVAALADRPRSAAEAGVGRVACRVSPIPDGVRVRAEIDYPRAAGPEMAVIETRNPQVWVAQGDTARQGRRLVTEADLYHVEGRGFAVDRSGLRITLLGGGKAVDIQGCPAG